MADEFVNSKIFALLFWYFKERHWTVQATSTIVRPRKEPNAYEAGDLVLAKFQGRPYRAAVIGIEDNKDDLAHKIKDLDDLLKNASLTTKDILKKMGFLDEDLKNLNDGSEPEEQPSLEPETRREVEIEAAEMPLPPLQHTKRATKKQKRTANEQEKEVGGDDPKKKKKLQKDAALDEIDRLLLDLTPSPATHAQSPSTTDTQIQNQAPLSNIIGASHGVLFDYPIMDSQAMENENVVTGNCCAHCTNLHVRLDKLEEEFKHIKNELLRKDFFHQQQQQQFQQQLQQLQHHQQQFQHHQQQQHFQQHQQQQQNFQQQQPCIEDDLPPQQPQAQQQDKILNGFTKEQLLGKIRHLAFSKACKTLCRMIFSESEREGHSVTGLGGKAGLIKEKLEDLYGIIQQQSPGPQSSTQAINIKLAEVLKPSAKPKK